MTGSCWFGFGTAPRAGCGSSWFRWSSSSTSRAEAMTVGELIAELSKFDPSHLACVKLYSRTYPAESQVFAQGVFHVPPWHEGGAGWVGDRKSTRLNSSHVSES